MDIIVKAAQAVAALGTRVTDAGNSLSASVVEQAPTVFQPSFNGSPTLFLWNLFLMTTGFFLGAMLGLRQASRIWHHRKSDGVFAPVTLYRVITLFAGIALTIRCGAEALSLWGWSPDDPVTTARVMMAKRYLDPFALVFGFSWMGIVLVGEPGIEGQLREEPLPEDRWSGWPAIQRAGVVIVLCFGASLVGVLFR